MKKKVNRVTNYKIIYIEYIFFFAHVIYIMRIYITLDMYYIRVSEVLNF